MDIGELKRIVCEDAAFRRRQILQATGGKGDSKGDKLKHSITDPPSAPVMAWAHRPPPR